MRVTSLYGKLTCMMWRIGGHVISDQLDKFQYIARVTTLVSTEEHLQALLQEFQVVRLEIEIW